MLSAKELAHLAKVEDVANFVIKQFEQDKKQPVGPNEPISTLLSDPVCYEEPLASPTKNVIFQLGQVSLALQSKFDTV